MNASDREQTMLDGLRRAGLKITAQRVAIARLLAAARSHPTARAIYARLRPRFPGLSLTTVYNTLRALVALGLIHDLGEAGDGAVHFDADASPHLNLVCTKCGRIVDFPEVELLPALEAVGRRSGFELHGARLAYYGLCPACRRTHT